MAPIVTPDGTEVEEVILPDGSEAVEVIAPDGTVVFEGPIPDSGEDHQYVADGFDDPWLDRIGDADMQVFGLSASTFGNGETSVSGDGTDEYGLADGPQFIFNKESFGVAFTFETTDSDAQFGVVQEHVSEINVAGVGVESGGQVNLTLRDDNGATTAVETEQSYNDGDQYLCVINKNDDNTDNWNFYVSDMENAEDTTVTADQGTDSDNMALSDEEFAFWARNDGGSIDSHINADMGFWGFNPDPYTEQERKDLQSALPEV